jgi:hypothetical protein
MEPAFTFADYVIRDSDISAFYDFAVQCAQNVDWGNSKNVALEGNLQQIAADRSVVRQCEKYFKLLENPPPEDVFSGVLRDLKASIGIVAQWEFEDIERDAVCGGLVAYPTANPNILPAVKGRSDEALGNAIGGARKIGMELKKPDIPHLQSGCFWLQTLVTHLGRDCLATAAIAGDRIAVVWSEKGSDEIIELFKTGQGTDLLKLGEEEFLKIFILFLSLAANPIVDLIKEQQQQQRHSFGSADEEQKIQPFESSVEENENKENEFELSDLGSREGFSSEGELGEEGSGDGRHFDREAEAFPQIPADILILFKVRAKDGSIWLLSRFREFIYQFFR